MRWGGQMDGDLGGWLHKLMDRMLQQTFTATGLVTMTFRQKYFASLVLSCFSRVVLAVVSDKGGGGGDGSLLYEKLQIVCK